MLRITTAANLHLKAGLFRVVKEPAADHRRVRPMPLNDAAFTQLDDLCSRLSAESILVQAGSDEGLIPIYSLLGEMLEAAASKPKLVEPLRELQATLDVKLDAAQPFDADSIAAVQRVVAWLPNALAQARTGAEVTPPGDSGATPPVDATPDEQAGEDHAPEDQVLELNFSENHELLGEFHAEALDHLQQIEAALLTLDGAPDDRDALNSLFRSFHTIKGVSGFLHLTPMHTLSHEVESLMDLARTGKLRLSSTIITVILQSRDALQEMIGQITAALERGHMPDTVVPVSHLIRQVRALAALGNGGGAAPVAPVVPISENVAHVSATAAEATPSSSPAASAASTPAPAAPSVPASSPAAGPAAHAPGTVHAPAGNMNVPAPTAASTVRVNTEKLDALMDMVGELVIVQSQLQESARSADRETSSLARNLTQLGRITKELQHNAMSLRMIPIKPTFQRMERLVRDLSREFGKKIAFQTAGEDTEIDRSVTEEIADPLVHMVRNALDHGLETPAERVAAGKGESGTVTLRAYHEGSSLVIELSDDGRGINPEKVLKKARQQNLIPQDVELSDSDIFQLIFLPGFSTADKVTSVSGRGVGMDVVKRNIEKLRGSIQIESAWGKGSTFRIRLPLTTAIIDGLLVRVGPDRFILPSTTVQMALRPARTSLVTVQGRGEVLDHRGHLLPLHRLHRRFAIGGAVEDPVEGIVVVVENGVRPYALLVDELLNKQEVVVKNLGSFLQQLPGVAGGAILGDGNIALILDPASLCAAA